MLMNDFDILVDSMLEAKVGSCFCLNSRIHCKLNEKSVCRVSAGNVSLGVLVPSEDGFHLEAKLPVKRFLNQSPDFKVMPNRPVVEGRFIPLSPEEPFAYIERLKDGYLARQDGKIGVIIK